MKVLFLDIDGVLNNSKTPVRHEDGFMIAMDPYMVFLVNKLAEFDGVKVVLSSSWRYMKEWDRLMRANGLVFEFLGRTPLARELGLTDKELTKIGLDRTGRGVEIRTWLERHPEVTRYAILDDTDEFLEDQKPNFFQTDYKVGLTDEIMGRVREHLNKE